VPYAAEVPSRLSQDVQTQGSRFPATASRGDCCNEQICRKRTTVTVIADRAAACRSRRAVAGVRQRCSTFSCRLLQIGLARQRKRLSRPPVCCTCQLARAPRLPRRSLLYMPPAPDLGGAKLLNGLYLGLAIALQHGIFPTSAEEHPFRNLSKMVGRRARNGQKFLGKAMRFGACLDEPEEERGHLRWFPKEAAGNFWTDRRMMPLLERFASARLKLG